MKAFVCQRCGIPITGPLRELPTLDLLSGAEGEEGIVREHYVRLPEDSDLLGTPGHWVAHLDDLLNVDTHPDEYRLIGCCGPTGAHGINTICRHGHEVGTRVADCFTSHFIDLDPELVLLVDADHLDFNEVKNSMFDRGWRHVQGFVHSLLRG